jgi:GT2 family glycosyltransferase
MTPAASVVITTRNRKQELENAVASALAQEVEGGVEVIVVDDGSTDGTSEMIAAKFPQVMLHRFEPSRGYIVQRNFGARVARAPFIFSIDDDAIFTAPTIVADIVKQFDQPRIGAIAIPFINVCQDANVILQQAPSAEGVHVCPSYIGTAHALRRDLFLSLGGYREAYFHQGEESDYCLRMLQAGYLVRLARSAPIHHFESPRRDFRRVDLYGRRNNVLFGWYNVPGHVLPFYLAATSWHGLAHGFRVRRPWTMVEGLAKGYRSIWTLRTQRAPISTPVFRLYRDLVRQRVASYAQVVDRLPCPALAVAAEEDAARAKANTNVSIIITTKNRVGELSRTVPVLRQLSPPPLEIIITADGCTDGTVDFIKAQLPQARVIVNQTARGSIASRDQMIREARGELVLSLDDDSYPEQLDCLARIAPLFAQRPRMAVLHFPQHSDEYPATLGAFDFGSARKTRSYSNAGAVLRRSTYIELNGYETTFFHAYEEPDFALRCIAAGYEIYYEPSVTVRHHYSGLARSEMRTHHRHACNEFWSALLRVPFPYVVPVAVYRVASQFGYACSRGVNWIVREPSWWLPALAGIPRCLRARKLVRWSDYRAWLELPEVGRPDGEAGSEPRPPRATVESMS